MDKRKSFKSKLSKLVSNTRNKAAFLSLSILFTIFGIMWQEKYISFNVYPILTAIPLSLNFLFISITIGLLSLFWIFNHNPLAVRKAFKNELEPSFEHVEILQKNILGEPFLQPNQEESNHILNSEIDFLPTETLEKRAQSIAELSDETGDEVLEKNELELSPKDKIDRIKVSIAARLKKDIFNILSNR